MKDEVLEKALGTDASVIPRYDIVKPDGTKVAENVQVVLKNNVLVSGTPLNKQSLLKDDTASAFELNPATAVPDDALKLIRGSISYCPKIRVTAVAGAALYVRHNITGIEKTYVVPSTGEIIVDVWDYGTYTIWGVLGGVTTSTATVDVDVTKMYTASVDFYVTYWQFTVAAEVGATIKATHTDGTIITGTVGSDKTCKLALPKIGTWTAVGTYDSCDTGVYTLNATTEMIGTTRNTNIAWITIVINITAGSNITISSGNTSKGGTSTGSTYKAWLPFKGTWAITAVLGSSVATTSVNISEYRNYSVALAYYVTYGVRIPLGNSSPTAVEYTDDAVGMSTGYTAWANKKIFSTIKPCLLLDGVVQYYLNKTNLEQKEDGTTATINSTTAGDVMVEVPKIGYRIYSDSNYLYVKITDNPNSPDFCYLAHSLDGLNDCSKIYYGAYLMNYAGAKPYSVSGMIPTTNNTMDYVRDRIKNTRGTGYQMMSFYPWTLLQCLFLIVYKSLDGQTALGVGHTGQQATGSAKVAGGTNAKGPCYGETTGSQQMCFLNIEDMWGNLQQWLDGAYLATGGTLLTAYKDFNNTGANYPYQHTLPVTPLNGFISDVQGTNNSGFIAKAVAGSTTTYYCDYGTVYTGSALVVSAVFHATKLYGGPFGFASQLPSNGNENIGARLMYKRKG